MEQISSMSALIQKKTLRDEVLPKIEAESEKPRKPTDFEKRLDEFLTPMGKEEVSEEELFAAVTRERMRSLKGKGAAKHFDKIMDQNIQGFNGSSFSYEDVTKYSLNQMVGARKISHDDANIIYSQAFAAAQLDHRANALYGDAGNARAVADVSTAIQKAQTVVDKINGKQWELLIRDRFEPQAPEVNDPITRGSDGTFDGSGGFLYKAFSDVDGNVLVLAPEELNGVIDRVELRDMSGQVLETAESTGIGYSGREYIRFNKSGSEYPQKITVNFILASGGVESYAIPDTSLEWD